MKVFVAGGSGAVGGRLIPLLVKAGHAVVATSRTPAKAALLRAAGAEPAILDALDRDAVIAEVRRARPDAIVHHLTRRLEREGETDAGLGADLYSSWRDGFRTGLGG